MSQRAKSELEDLSAIMGHPGWVVFVRDCQDQINHIEASSLDIVKSMEDLAYRKGIRDALRTVLSYETAVEAALAEWEDGGDDDETATV